MELLQLGSQGQLVKYLQKKLVQLNYSLFVNEIFDDRTNYAVLDFQSRNNLARDGVVGGNTWTRIYLLTEHARSANSFIERQNNILHLHPVVRTSVVNVYTKIQSEGIPFKVFEAYRYPQRQAQLYAQGRSTTGKIVTYAKPWSSYHQYGLAVDFVLFINDKWSWENSRQTKNWWDRLHELGRLEGLMRLDFELPHLQLSGTSLNALRQGIYPPGGDQSWLNNFAIARK